MKEFMHSWFKQVYTQLVYIHFCAGPEPLGDRLD